MTTEDRRTARGLGASGPVQTSGGFTHSALDAPAPALTLLGSDGTVLVWGEGCRRLLGYRAQDVVGRSVERLLKGPIEDVSWSSAPGGVGRRGARQSAGAVVEVEHRDGGSFRLTVEIVALTGTDGSSCWFVAVTGAADGQETDGTQATLVDRSRFAVAVWDSDLRLMWMNRASRESMGLTGGGDSRASVLKVLRGFDRTTIEPVIREVQATGEPVTDHVVRWVSPADGQEIVFSSSLFPLAPADGTSLGVCSVSLDITQTWERKRLILLGRAAHRIGTTLDVMTTAQELADMAVPALADYAAVDLAEAVPLGGEPLEHMPEAESGVPVFRRAGLATLHDQTPEYASLVGEVVYVPPRSPYLTALHDGQTYFKPIMETGPGTWLDRDPRRRLLVRETGMHSVMMIPLRARGTILGLAVIARTDNIVPFSRDDLLLAEELAVQASLSLDNARRYARERTAALTLQRSLLPEELSGGDAVDLASRYLPSDRHEGVGGDWMDAIELPGGRIALVIGDVVGHGIHAAATMGRLRTAVHTLAVLDQPPAELLNHLNDVTAQLTQSDTRSTDYPSITGASCLYAVYDPATRVCTMARAGHPPPMLVTPDGHTTTADVPVGPPIGTDAGPCESVDLELPPGSLLALYTDGLVESRHVDIDAGLDRLADALRNPPADLDALCSRVIARMTPQTPPEDDVALLVARARAPSPAIRPAAQRAHRRSDGMSPGRRR